MTNSNFIILIIAIIVLIAIIIFVNNKQPIPNSGSLPENMISKSKKRYVPKGSDELDDDYPSLFDSEFEKKSYVDKSNNEISAMDPDDDKYSVFDTNEKILSDNDSDGIFTHKKQKFTRKTPEDIKDLFDVEKLKPQEYEDWFDVVPMENTKRIKSTHLINPKQHLGIGTSAGCKKGGLLDIRGPVKVEHEKNELGPWGISTIQKDPYARGLCDY